MYDIVALIIISIAIIALVISKYMWRYHINKRFRLIGEMLQLQHERMNNIEKVLKLQQKELKRLTKVK